MNISHELVDEELGVAFSLVIGGEAALIAEFLEVSYTVHCLEC